MVKEMKIDESKIRDLSGLKAGLTEADLTFRFYITSVG